MKKLLVYAPWVLALVGLLVALWLVHRLNVAKSATKELERVMEKADLERKGQEVVDQLARKELKDRAAQLEAENADLKAAREAAQRASPGAQVVAGGRGSTGGVTAAGPPRPTGSYGPYPLEGPACLVMPGDELGARCSVELLETKGANLVLVGAGEVWRLTPAPAARLAAGPFHQELTTSFRQAPPASLAARWGVGPLLAGGKTGWMAGALLAPPAWALWGFQLEPVVGGALGPGGGWVGLAGILVRPP